jgi:pyridoxine kinase
LSVASHLNCNPDVGNKAAVFPLQLLGFEVDIINSVHFSNHTGYAQGFKGDVLKGEQLLDIMQGLKDNQLLSNTGHLLTGYIGSLSFLEAVLDVLTLLRQHGTVRYVCDPVLGDQGHLYVPRELVAVYRERVVPLADVITPNQFEVEQLTGLQVNSLESAKKACNALHDIGPSIVCITSIAFPGNDTTMSIVASQRKNGDTEAWYIEFPRLPGNYTGTGDLCAALLLAHTDRFDSLPEALEKVIDTMSVIIERTRQSFDGTAQSCELKLIQSKACIENPPQRFKVKRLQTCTN